MNNPTEIEAIQVHIKILEERKRQLESNIANLVSVINECKSWIENADHKALSFSQLIMICLHASAEGVMKDKTIAAESTYSGQQQCEGSEQCGQDTSLMIGIEKSMVDKIMARLEVIDEAISSITSSKKLQEYQISELTERFEIMSNNLDDRQEKLEKKSRKFSSGMNKNMNKLEQSILNHEGLIQQLSNGLEKTDLMTKEKFNDIYNRTSSVEQVIITHEQRFEQLQSNIDEIKKDYILLKNNIEKSESTIDWLKDLMKREKIEHRKELNNLEKSCGCSIKFLMSKVLTVQRNVENNTTHVIKNKQKIKYLDSELQVLPAKLGEKRPYLVIDRSSVIDNNNTTHKRTDITKRRDGVLIVRNLITIITHSPDLIDNNGRYDEKTGIFAVPSNGLYLVNFKVENCCKQPVMLAHVLKSGKVIYGFQHILVVEAVNGIAQSCHVIYLKEGDEICLCMRNNEKSILNHFACVKLQ